jgi:hypothetical protein
MMDNEAGAEAPPHAQGQSSWPEGQSATRASANDKVINTAVSHLTELIKQVWKHVFPFLLIN